MRFTLISLNFNCLLKKIYNKIKCTEWNVQNQQNKLSKRFLKQTLIVCDLLFKILKCDYVDNCPTTSKSGENLDYNFYVIHRLAKTTECMVNFVSPRFRWHKSCLRESKSQLSHFWCCPHSTKYFQRTCCSKNYFSCILNSIESNT